MLTSTQTLDYLPALNVKVKNDVLLPKKLCITYFAEHGNFYYADQFIRLP